MTKCTAQHRDQCSDWRVRWQIPRQEIGGKVGRWLLLAGIANADQHNVSREVTDMGRVTAGTREQRSIEYENCWPREINGDRGGQNRHTSKLDVVFPPAER